MVLIITMRTHCTHGIPYSEVCETCHDTRCRRSRRMRAMNLERSEAKKLKQQMEQENNGSRKQWNERIGDERLQL